MVKIEIKDRVWNVYKNTWALDDVTEHDEVVRMLEVEMLGISTEVIKDVERNPEANGLQEISLKDDRREKNENNT